MSTASKTRSNSSSSIEDPHQFSGRAPTPVRDLAALERFHEWNELSCTSTSTPPSALNSLNPSSAHFEASAMKTPTRGTAAPNATPCAEAPLLNPAAIGALFPPARPQPKPLGSWKPVPVPIAEKGDYLVEAVHRDLRAYTVILIRFRYRCTSVCRRPARGRVVNLVLDRRTGEPILRRNGLARRPRQELRQHQEPEPTVSPFLPFDGKQADDVRIVARGVGQSKDDYAVNTLAGYAFGVNPPEDLMGYRLDRPPVLSPRPTPSTSRPSCSLKSAASCEIPA